MMVNTKAASTTAGMFLNFSIAFSYDIIDQIQTQSKTGGFV